LADDQLFVEPVNGMLIGRPPPAIRGLAEFRGAGIHPVEWIEAAPLHHVVRLVAAPFEDRLAPADERHDLIPGHALPVSRLAVDDHATAFERLVAMAPIPAAGDG
ncbi:HPr kinase/phosphorylase, partial [Rhizobium sp. TRM95111]|nr:HPr kinase/phosphorylase [Rhizobium alarense]